KILATSIEVASVYLNSRPFIEGQKLLKSKEVYQNYEIIYSILGLSKNELDTKCKQYTRFCLAKELDLSSAFKLKHIPGIDVETWLKRIYPYGNVASYVIGRTNIDGKGYSGVEYEFEELLSNLKKKEIFVYKSGKIQKNPVRLVNISDVIELTEEDKNFSVVLTIDIDLQCRVESILKKFYEIYTPNLLACIIQKSDTGEILVMSFFPETAAPLSIPALHYTYEPGSIFKIFNMAVFLEKGVVRKNDIINCENGKFQYNGITITDVKPYQYLSVEDIIVYSSNIGMAKLVLKFANDQTLYEYLNLFGFGNMTGIEFATEARGYVPCVNSNNYSPTTSLYVSFGQGVSATMLQMVNSYTTIANDGYLLQPYIIKNIITSDNRIIQQGKKCVIRKVISEQTAKILKEMMYQTVERGTAQKAKLHNLKICAKTGTAQKFDKKLNRYSETKYLMSCCGFFPMEKPEFTLGVFVDEPTKGKQASDVAVPIFKEIITELINYYTEVVYAKAD
ncbi:MAG: penicillin-binding protein 2, partial [Endomicrobia bacterium]|nr:penicillin-binding protein 2 [Endomicrobiia bacterium]